MLYKIIVLFYGIFVFANSLPRFGEKRELPFVVFETMYFGTL